MTGFRYLATFLILIEGLAVTFAGPFLLLWRYQVDMPWAEVLPTFGMTAVIYGMAVYQLYHDRPRTMAWITSAMSAIIFWWTLIAILPLGYLLTRAWVLRTQRKAAEAEAKTSGTLASPTSDNGSGLETLVWLAMMAGYGFVWNALPAWVHPVEPADGVAWTWVAFILGTTLVTFFHELGHWFGGATSGFRMLLFAVYPFTYTRSLKRSYFKVNFKLPLSGMYAGIPLDIRDLEQRHLWMVICGPLGGILYAAVCWNVLQFARGSIGGIVYGVLSTGMSFGLIVNLVNLLPIKIGAQRLDGRVLWDALFDRQATEATLALLGCMSSMRGELRPRDWPDEWLTELRRHKQDPLAITLLGYSAEDRLQADPTSAVAHEDLMRTCAGLLALSKTLRELGAPAVGFELQRAWLRNRYFGERVEVDLEAASKEPETEPFEILRLDAVLRAYDGDPAQALTLLAQAEASLAADPPTGVNATDLEGLRVYRARLQASQPAGQAI